MGQERWFFRNPEEWSAIAGRLKLTPCPHCQVVGTLIRHGALYGFDENNPRRQTLRARRIFCSNRHARRGCGRTFAVWAADKIRRLGLTTAGLWRFLQRAVAGRLAAAIRQLDCHLSDRTVRRIWKRFHQAQCPIRTALLGRCPPPELPDPPPHRPTALHRPTAQVLTHLRTAFPNAPCPIAAFQHALRIFFL